MEIIHCVINMEDTVTLCGEQGMKPALDLFSRSWPEWRIKFPDQNACKKCDNLWRPIFINMEKQRNG